MRKSCRGVCKRVRRARVCKHSTPDTLHLSMQHPQGVGRPPRVYNLHSLPSGCENPAGVFASACAAQASVNTRPLTGGICQCSTCKEWGLLHSLPPRCENPAGVFTNACRAPSFINTRSLTGCTCIDPHHSLPLLSALPLALLPALPPTTTRTSTTVLKSSNCQSKEQN
jgi:hypothetical protein